MSSEQMNLDPVQVSSWLDNNPDFLNEYLKNKQIQRRSSIINERSSSLLSNLHSNIRTTTNIERMSSVNELNNYSQSWGTAPVKKFTKFTFYGSNNARNQSFSEPNLPNSESNSLQQISSIPAKRKNFKQLGIYEKMYTLVKTLYESLDLKTTCKKILNTVSLLLDADRCSLFLVVDDDKAESKKCLISVVFDAQSVSKLLELQSPNELLDTDAESSYEQIKIQFGQGIAGHVALTGESLNIPDAYLDSRFNSNIDKITGYRTKSILCLPILNELGECIAVAEAINKTNYDETIITDDASLCFSQEDEETFSKFMPFIAVNISFCFLYIYRNSLN
jgi:dual 3',5'-cyclic-AMP and -GMP phosphodiesterase 11